MSTSTEPFNQKLQADVEELRPRFPRTHDLYREVCVLLFFRYGMTPTANKLYQLVRKGSMSAPTQALHDFWNLLRDRSRVTIEHAGLPDDLRTAAGEMVAAIWKSAQTMSREELAVFRAEAETAVEGAKAGEAEARAGLGEALRALEEAHDRLRTQEELTAQLREDLAAAAARRAGLDAELEGARRQVETAELRSIQANAEHAAERQQLAKRTQLAEERFADMEKRALLEIDRERTAAAKLQKSLEAERVAHLAAGDRMRADFNAAHQTIGQLRQDLGGLQSGIDTLTKERGRERDELMALRAQLDAAIREAAGDKARADQLGHALEKITAGSKPRPQRTVRPSAGQKPKRKATESGGA